MRKLKNKVKYHKTCDIFHFLRNVFTSGYLDVIQIEQNGRGSRKWACFRPLQEVLLTLLTCVFPPLQVPDVCINARYSNKDEYVLHFKNPTALTFTPPRLFLLLNSQGL